MFTIIHKYIRSWNSNWSCGYTKTSPVHFYVNIVRTSGYASVSTVIPYRVTWIKFGILLTTSSRTNEVHCTITSFYILYDSLLFTVCVMERCQKYWPGKSHRQVVCRDVVGALVLLMNLQLDSHANRVNATTDSSMFRIKSSTTNQAIHTNSFLRVNKAFCYK